MDKNRWCRLKEEHRLYHAIGCVCPCYEEMLKERKERIAKHRAKNPYNKAYNKVVRAACPYTPAKNRREIG